MRLGRPAADCGLRTRSAVAVLAIGAAFAPRVRSPHSALRSLRVCADPNNLPFSNERQQGFENAIASLVAREMHASLSYVWWPQRRGFVKRTLGAGTCDVVIGVPVGYDPVLTTRPYYTSSYVFVARDSAWRSMRSLDDPRLARARIGVALIGSHYRNTPPGHALAERGIVSNVVGFPVYGDYARRDAPPELINAVARGAVDVALVWGPSAGYWAARLSTPAARLSVSPIAEPRDSAALPMRFSIAMAVRRGDDSAPALRDTLNAIIARRRGAIDAILDRYHVPRTE
jgi:quinoprotein dehydrogenase-associated probable ABC transporter substrate-binding protein